VQREISTDDVDVPLSRFARTGSVGEDGLAFVSVQINCGVSASAGDEG
jgi:hypothetical protein